MLARSSACSLARPTIRPPIRPPACLFGMIGCQPSQRSFVTSHHVPCDPVSLSPAAFSQPPRRHDHHQRPRRCRQELSSGKTSASSYLFARPARSAVLSRDQKKCSSESCRVLASPSFSTLFIFQFSACRFIAVNDSQGFPVSWLPGERFLTIPALLCRCRRPRRHRPQRGVPMWMRCCHCC